MIWNGFRFYVVMHHFKDKRKKPSHSHYHRHVASRFVFQQLHLEYTQLLPCRNSEKNKQEEKKKPC